MIIDFHTHTFPDKIAETAIPKMQTMSHSAAFTKGTVAALKDSMLDAGIDYSVVLPVITNPTKTQNINDISISANGKEGLFYFGGIHPDSPDVSKELKRLKDNGICGIKIHPIYQQADIDDIKFLRILYSAAENGLAVVTHSGDDIGFPGVRHCTVKMLSNALRQVGNVTLIAAHMGGWKNWDKVEELASFKNLLVDTAFSIGSITPTDNHYSAEELSLLAEEEFLKLIKVFGSERVLFGTDSPWDSQNNLRRTIENLSLSQKDKNNIFYKNAARILNVL